MNEEVFKAELSALHDRLGFALGWDFAVTPMANLAHADTIIVGLNPGEDDPAKSWESDDGNAYFTGKWQRNGGAEPTIVQTQVRALHELLNLHQDDVFAAQFFPFRSANFDEMSDEQKKVGLEYSRRLWSWVISQSKAQRFICMGTKVAAPEIAKLVNAKLELPRLDSGWGNFKIDRYVSEDGKVVVGWPHPSRFQLFTLYDPSKRAVAMESMRYAARQA